MLYEWDNESMKNIIHLLFIFLQQDILHKPLSMTVYQSNEGPHRCCTMHVSTGHPET